MVSSSSSNEGARYSSITAFGRNGLADWLFQRVSAVIIAAYALFLIGYFLCHPHLNYVHWQTLFACNWMRLFTLFTLVAIEVHVWIGLWIVFTDYIKCPRLRLLLEVLLILLLTAYTVWGSMMIWG